MCLYSEFRKNLEKQNLAPYAIKADDPWYTVRDFDKSKKNIPDNEKYLDLAGDYSRYKTDFEIDRDRIINSQAFRRLEYKTQVFVNHEGDNYRTRLTHTLEVAMVAKHIAQALRLNYDLVEAMALGHDIGHAPFGHAGEDAINELVTEQSFHAQYFFCHNRQSIEVVEKLEGGYDWDQRHGEQFKIGMNLTRATKEGIFVHTSRGLISGLIRNSMGNKGIYYPGSIEAQVVCIADEIAQRIHDLEDGLRSGLLTKNEIIGNIKESIYELFQYYTEKDNRIEFSPTKLKEQPDNEYFNLLSFEQNINSFYKQFEGIIKTDIAKNDNFINKEDYIGYTKVLFAIIARLLFMWRGENYANTLNETDKADYVNRILKYLHIYLLISNEDIKLLQINAFLRGLFISNVIEHSFYKIHRNFNSNSEAVFSDKENLEEKNDFYLIFLDKKCKDKESKQYETKACIIKIAVADQNMSEQEYNKFKDAYDKLSPDIKEKVNRWLIFYQEKFQIKPLYCYVLTSNIGTDKYQIDWSNKSEDLGKSEFVFIKYDNTASFKVRKDKLQIYFNNFSYAEFPDQDLSKSQILEKLEEKVLVDFSHGLKLIDNKLCELIHTKIHYHSKVVRMSVKGTMMIKKLFKVYYENPRVMHNRVWEKLPLYSIISALSTFKKYEGEIPTVAQLEELKTESNGRLLLIRRIIDHISGMTDRFIYDEYARLFSTQKEIESPEEIYFYD